MKEEKEEEIIRNFFPYETQIVLSDPTYISNVPFKSIFSQRKRKMSFLMKEKKKL
jgi:hypothetical protein